MDPQPDSAQHHPSKQGQPSPGLLLHALMTGTGLAGASWASVGPGSLPSFLTPVMQLAWNCPLSLFTHPHNTPTTSQQLQQGGPFGEHVPSGLREGESLKHEHRLQPAGRGSSTASGLLEREEQAPSGGQPDACAHVVHHHGGGPASCSTPYCEADSQGGAASALLPAAEAYDPLGPGWDDDVPLELGWADERMAAERVMTLGSMRGEAGVEVQEDMAGRCEPALSGRKAQSPPPRLRHVVGLRSSLHTVGQHITRSRSSPTLDLEAVGGISLSPPCTRTAVCCGGFDPMPASTRVQASRVSPVPGVPHGCHGVEERQCRHEPSSPVPSMAGQAGHCNMVPMQASGNISDPPAAGSCSRTGTGESESHVGGGWEPESSVAPCSAELLSRLCELCCHTPIHSLASLSPAALLVAASAEGGGGDGSSSMLSPKRPLQADLGSCLPASPSTAAVPSARTCSPGHTSPIPLRLAGWQNTTASEAVAAEGMLGGQAAKRIKFNKCAEQGVRDPTMFFCPGVAAAMVTD